MHTCVAVDSFRQRTRAWGSRSGQGALGQEPRMLGVRGGGEEEVLLLQGEGRWKGGWGGSEKGAEKGEERTASTEELSRCVELSQTRNVHLNP